jgi:hypothetical protein
MPRPSSGVAYKYMFRIGNSIYLQHLQPQQITTT